MTEQEFFTQTLIKIRAQGGPSRASTSLMATCAYRGVGGRGCAIGVHLPDEAARKADACASTEIAKPGPRRIANAAGIPKGRLRCALQRAHDAFASAPDDLFFTRWEPEMREIAARYGLEYLEPTP